MAEAPSMKLPAWRSGRQSYDGARQQKPWRRHSKAVDIGCRWRSFSYDRLPQALLRLSVLRLDGSSFDVRVVRTASVGELKMAVEDIHSGSQGGGRGNVSWSHVWGHFCLCYMNHKLTENKTMLKTLGIKDGDKLQFIRKHPRKSGGLQSQEQGHQI